MYSVDDFSWPPGVFPPFSLCLVKSFGSLSHWRLHNPGLRWIVFTWQVHLVVVAWALHSFRRWCLYCEGATDFSWKFQVEHFSQVLSTSFDQNQNNKKDSWKAGNKECTQVDKKKSGIPSMQHKIFQAAFPAILIHPSWQLAPPLHPHEIEKSARLAWRTKKTCEGWMEHLLLS